MEINLSSIEKSDQTVWSSDDPGLGHARTYTCTFCKRGFSNAQALGGHMNIHRKDRAKLKEFSDETLIPVDMAKKNPSDQVPEDDNSLQAKTSEEKSSSPNRPSIFSREDDDASRSKDGTIGELQQLPLFGEMPSTRNDQEPSGHVGGHVEKSLQPSSSQKELDLELRLGPEPHGRS